MLDKLVRDLTLDCCKKDLSHIVNCMSNGIV
uniref:Uncharacterized protein n=1 Tax=Rhizophora mucronata TaxID=61149 RepID=A0A2P2P0Z7_RHIMU